MYRYFLTVKAKWPQEFFADINGGHAIRTDCPLENQKELCICRGVCSTPHALICMKVMKALLDQASKALHLPVA